MAMAVLSEARTLWENPRHDGWGCGWSGNSLVLKANGSPGSPSALPTPEWELRSLRQPPRPLLFLLSVGVSQWVSPPAGW